MQNIIINADDFGISKGVNSAIIKMATEGRLNSVSIFAKAKYTDEAIDFCKENKQILSGLHFNLTTGSSVLGNKKLPTLTDDKGNFKFGFIGLLLNIFKPDFLIEVELELIAQLEILKTLKISHIDGHRHVHFIPKIFSIVNKISKQNNIQRIRVINEGLFSIIKYKKFSFLYDGGIIKLIILRLCGLFNGSLKIKAPYMFSILYTGKITNELIQAVKIPNGFEQFEIMIHPGTPEIDKNDSSIEYEKEALFSEYRKKESELNLYIK